MSKNISIINGIAYKNVGTHETHCCKRHGCKYGYGVCPVADGATVQRYACEYCVSVRSLETKIANLQEELEWSKTLENRGLVVDDNDFGW